MLPHTLCQSYQILLPLRIWGVWTQPQPGITPAATSYISQHRGGGVHPIYSDVVAGLLPKPPPPKGRPH